MRFKWVDGSGKLGVGSRCYPSGILTLCSTGDQTKTLDKGLRRDDARNFIAATTTNIVPAQAKTQCLCLYACSANYLGTQPPHTGKICPTKQSACTLAR
jgi:hypothetical protein